MRPPEEHVLDQVHQVGNVHGSDPAAVVNVSGVVTAAGRIEIEHAEDVAGISLRLSIVERLDAPVQPLIWCDNVGYLGVQ